MPSILVVDDEPRIASFVQRALTAEGFRVDTADDGVKALKMAKSGRYELVVLDLLLPGVDGVTVLRGIIDHYPEQRVLVLSALGDVESKVRCLEIGASDYLCKPFALSELLARVRARLRQAPAPAPDRFLRVGPVALDLLRRVADTGRGPVILSEREFSLLQYLMRQDGEVCSREQLLAEVWNVSFDTGSNVVDVTVGRLRSKLGDDAIETVRNVGYRINAA
jgi:two-component system copper resistance phosphate regulon response regulator CusR